MRWRGVLGHAGGAFDVFGVIEFCFLSQVEGICRVWLGKLLGIFRANEVNANEVIFLKIDCTFVKAFMYLRTNNLEKYFTNTLY